MCSMPLGRHVDELGNIHRAIGGRRVLDQNRRRVVALLVDVRQKHLRIRRAALGREDQPAAVGREAVPGVHQRRVAASSAAPARPRPEQCKAGCPGRISRPFCACTKTIHLPSGEIFGKLLLMPFCEAPSNRLGLAAPAVIEGNAVKVVLDRNLGGIVGVCGHLAVRGVGFASLRANKDQVLAVGTPHGAGLHKTRIVGARQRLQLLCHAVIPDQNSPRGIEDLQKAVILEVGHVVKLTNSSSPAGGWS